MVNHETDNASSSSSSSSSDVTKPDSCYNPRCRKDANCTRKICMASFNATLDLMRASVQKSSFMRLSAASRPKPSRTPVSFDTSVMSSPTSGGVSPIPEFPSVVSKERRTDKEKKVVKGKEENTSGDARGGRRMIETRFWRWVLILSLVLAGDFGFYWIASRTIAPELSSGVVRRIGEKSWVVGDVDGNVRSMETGIARLVDGRVSGCGDLGSVWKISQEELILRSGCVLYKATVEEVSLWGWPLQAAGLLTTASSKSFTTIKGRVTLWSDGKIGYKVLGVNDSWVQVKWSSSVVQLDPETLILEYRRSLMEKNDRN